MQKNELERVTFELKVIRGFENILHHKKLLDVPRIAARVCGLCHASHAIASCKAIENMFQITPSSQSIKLRKLVMVGELLNSDSMHFFFHALPDLFSILKGREKPFSLSELTKFDPVLTEKMLELIKIGKDLEILLGGRAPHTITIVIGGVAIAPTRKIINSVRKYLQRAIINLHWVLERYQDLFSEPLPAKFKVPISNYLGIQNHGFYDFYGGMLRINQNYSSRIDFNFADYEKYIDRIENIQGKMPGIYLVKEREQVLTGPLARYNVLEKYGIEEVEPYLKFIKKIWKENILISSYLRLIEMLAASYKGMQILEDTTLINPVQISPWKDFKSGPSEGIGAVEAPRGTLIHHYQINEKGVLEKVKLLVATEINLPTINEILTLQSKLFYQQNKDLDELKQYAQMILRTFDPCIACATH
ncbi:MAG: nickel-dependent hydrogenase large subunit [Candidatus Helarchaeota archaeon]